MSRTTIIVLLTALAVPLIPLVASAQDSPSAAGTTPQAYIDEVTADSPISWWRLDEAAGATAADTTGPNQGFIEGGVSPGVPGPFGEGSTGFRFDGHRCSGVNVGRQPNLFALQEMSVEAWVRTESTSSGLIWRWRHNGHWLSVSGGAHFSVYTNATQSAGGGVANDGEWHHVVGQSIGRELRVFLDGQLVDSRTFTSNVTYAGSRAVAIGRDANACDGVTSSFVGDIAQVAFYGQALSEERILAHYCAARPDDDKCFTGFRADAGPDQDVDEGNVVQLEGRAFVPTGSGDTASDDEIDLTIDAKANIFGAGHAVPPAPAGGGAGLLPPEVGLSLEAREFVTLSGATGTTTFHPGCTGPQSPPDGVRHLSTNINSWGGISGVIDDHRHMLLGVFLGPDTPTNPAPPRLDLTGRHDDEVYYPELHQSFFVGDGLTSEGVVQRFMVPEGATRLFLGIADAFEFRNNPGYYGDNCGAYHLRIHVHDGNTAPTYQWELLSASGPPITLSSASEPNPTFQAPDDGVYRFRLTVTHGVESVSDEVTIRVANVAPTPAARAAPTADDHLAMVSVSLEDPGILDTHIAHIDWGDGSPVETWPVLANGPGWGIAHGGHRYPEAGSFTISIEVEDKDGGRGGPVAAEIEVGTAGSDAPPPGAALRATGDTPPPAPPVCAPATAEVQPGATVEIAITDLLDGEGADAVLGGILIGSATADAQGAATIAAVVPPLEAGVYTLAVVGRSFDLPDCGRLTIPAGTPPPPPPPPPPSSTTTTTTTPGATTTTTTTTTSPGTPPTSEPEREVLGATETAPGGGEGSSGALPFTGVGLAFVAALAGLAAIAIGALVVAGARRRCRARAAALGLGILAGLLVAVGAAGAMVVADGASDGDTQVAASAGDTHVATGAADGVLVIDGAANRFDGLVQSNGNLVVAGEGQQLLGGTEYVTDLDVTGDHHIDPTATQIDPVPPHRPFEVAIYRPGGAAATEAGDAYHVIPPEECNGAGLARTWAPELPLKPGLYYTECRVHLDAGTDGTALHATIVSESTITVAGTGLAWEPFTGYLAALSAAGRNAITITGADHRFGGPLAATDGGVAITGDRHTLSCSLIASTVAVNADDLHVRAHDCGEAPDAPPPPPPPPPIPVAGDPQVMPALEADITVDEAVVAPGATVTFRASLTHGGGTLAVPGLIGIEHRGAVPTTVQAVTAALEVHEPGTGWRTLAGPDRVRVEALPIGAAPQPGTDTPVPAGDLAAWAALAVVELTPEELVLLADDTAIDGLRLVPTVATVPSVLTRTIARFSEDPLAALRSVGFDVEDAAMTITRPGMAAVLATADNEPALAALAPGDRFEVPVEGLAPTPPPRDVLESEDEYRARLLALDRSVLAAGASASGRTGEGTRILAPQAIARTRIGLPVLSLEASSPSELDAPGEIDWYFTVANWGSAAATDVDLVAIVGDTPLEFGGVPGPLGSGESVELGASTPVDDSTSATLIADATLHWDSDGITYGPVRARTSTFARPPQALQVTKFSSWGTGTPSGHFRYTIEVRNIGAETITGITLDDPVDPATLVVASTLEATRGTPTVDANHVRLDIGDLAPGVGVTLTFLVDARLAPPSQTRSVNQAFVTSDQLDPIGSDDRQQPGAADPTVTWMPDRPSPPGGPGVPGTPGGPGPGGPSGPVWLDPGPEIGDFAPVDGTELREPTPITATMTPRVDTEVTVWRVSAFPAGEPEASVLLGAGNGVPPAQLAIVDPTVLQNGMWVIRLEALDSGGGWSEAETAVLVTGSAKYGRFAITYEDLTTTVGSVPLAVRRTYDTLRAGSPGDFGHGWDLELASMRVQVHRPLGEAGWVQYSCGGGMIFTQMCFRTERPHFVTVTWPDGRVESFDFTPDGVSSWWASGVIPKYTASDGATSELLPAPGDHQVAFVGDGNMYAGGFAEKGIYDPQRFVLRANDGTEYLLDRSAGLVQARTRAGITIAVGPDGVRSSDGAEILFERGGDGRISAVTGPGDQRVSYERDAAGNLVGVTDLGGFETTFGYDGHHMVEIDDAGPGVFRKLVYDEDGRLASITDASGATTHIAVDVAGRTELVTSADGRLNTLSSLDERGNVVRVDQIHDGITRSTHFAYDERDLLLSRTDPSGRTWAATYDENLRLTSMTEPDGDGVTLTYDEWGALRTWTDGLGITTTYGYDDRGQLISIQNTDANISYTYDNAGRMTGRSDGTGETSWTYDAAGKVVSETTPFGTTTWTHDAAGRPVSRTGPDGTTTWAYDGGGNVVGRTTDVGTPAEETTTWKWDHSGNVTSVNGPEGSAIYEYDVRGLLSRHEGPDGVTTFAYDAMSRVIAEQGPFTSRNLVYDGGGRQIVEDTDEGTTTWTWDSDSRVISGSRGGLETSFNWSVDGRLASMESSQGRTMLSWDDAGRLVRVAAPDETQSFDWNAFGQLVGSSTSEAGGAAVGVLTAPALATGPGQVSTAPSLAIGAGEGVAVLPAQAAEAVSPIVPPDPPGGSSHAGPGASSGRGGKVIDIRSRTRKVTPNEYLELVFMALMTQPVVYDFVGTVGARFIDALLDPLTQLNQAPMQPPAPDGEPEKDPTSTPDDLPDSTDPQRRSCPDANPSMNNYYYQPTKPYAAEPTGESRAAAEFASAILYAEKTGENASSTNRPPGWLSRSQSDGLTQVHAGHLVAKRFGGSGEPENVVSQFLGLNLSRQKVQENRVAAALERCAIVQLDVRPAYHANRPAPADLWPDLLPVDTVDYRARNLVTGLPIAFDSAIPNRR